MTERRDAQRLGARLTGPPGTRHDTPAAASHRLLDLQAVAGNQAVVGLLAPRALQRQSHQAAGAGTAGDAPSTGAQGAAPEPEGAAPAWERWQASVTRPLGEVLRSLRPNHPNFRRALERLNEIQIAIDASDMLRDPRTRERAAITLESVLALKQAVERRTGRADRYDPEFMINAAHDRATQVVELAYARDPHWAGREAWDEQVRIPLEEARARVPRQDGEGDIDLEEASLFVQDAEDASSRLIGTVPSGDARLVAGQTFRAVLGALAAIQGTGDGHVGHDDIVRLAGLAYDDAVRMDSWASADAARATRGTPAAGTSADRAAASGAAPAS